MTPYRNVSGNSNVESYAITEDAIHVRFRSGTHRNYLYNSIRPGRAVVEAMKALATQGHGLNSYISLVVKSSYAERW